MRFPLSADQIKLGVFLHAVPGIGPMSILTILDDLNKNRIEPLQFWDVISRKKTKVPSIEKFLESIEKLYLEHTIDSYWGWLEKLHVRVVSRGQASYPSKFEQLARPPLLIYSQGKWPVRYVPALAVVGSRRCTPYGTRATKQLVKDCCEHGVESIISGLMYGIDAVAHQAAIEALKPTIAVLGYGIGYWYPPRMQQLGLDIITRGGALLSEYPPQMPPTKGTFLERNRLIAALADAVLVPEAAARSGTQRTVAVAAELGIPVGAVPGPFDSPFSQGTKACINEGATLVSSADDILFELGLGKILKTRRMEQPQHIVEQHLQAGPLSTDELCLTTQLSVVQLSFELSSLELAGRIVRRGGQWYRA